MLFIWVSLICYYVFIYLNFLFWRLGCYLHISWKSYNSAGMDVQFSFIVLFLNVWVLLYSYPCFICLGTSSHYKDFYRSRRNFFQRSHFHRENSHIPDAYNFRREKPLLPIFWGIEKNLISRSVIFEMLFLFVHNMFSNVKGPIKESVLLTLTFNRCVSFIENIRYVKFQALYISWNCHVDFVGLPFIYDCWSKISYELSNQNDNYCYFSLYLDFNSLGMT